MMKDVVINDCYGGFSLSHAAVMRYAELAGLTLYPVIDEIAKRHNPDVTFDDAFIVHYYTTPEHDEEKGYFSERSDIARDDEHLIQVVKEMKKKANGRMARLKVVSIPDDVEWQIEGYDGNEWIAEKHRTWS